MESALAKLKTKQILFIFDGLVTRLTPNPMPSPPYLSGGLRERTRFG
jgi:hypothetical protein